MHCLKYISVLPLFTLISGLQSDLFHLDTNAIVDDKILQEKWNLMESRMNSVVKTAIKQILPHAIEASSSLNISATCIKDAMKLVSGLRKMKIWAFKFLDATGKSIDGILGRFTTSLGNYDECINNEVIDEGSGVHQRKVLFRGKYCTLNIKPYLPSKPKKLRLFHTLEALRNFTSKDTIIGEMARSSHFVYYGLTISTAVCIPSGCSEDDMNQVLGKVADYIGGIIKSVRCEVKEDTPLTPAMVIVITLFSTAGILMIIGSMTDICYSRKKEAFKSTLIRILMSFSFISNFRKFTDTSISSGTFSCFHGIKVLTTSWIILTHTYFISTLALHKQPHAFEWPKEFLFQSLFNGTFAVNTFFFISGTLLCQGFLKSFKFDKRNFNVLTYVLHRVFRILPAYGSIIAFYFLLPLIGSGPLYYNVTDILYKPCLKNWWVNLLFVSNYYEKGNMCVMQGWYLSLDMQFYIGALIILLPLMRWPKLGITIAVAVTIASMIGSWLTMYINDLPPTFIYTPDPSDFLDMFTKCYIQPQSHVGSYCIGILCGYFLAMYPKFRIPKTLQVLGWCSSIVICVSVVNGVQKWNSGAEPTFWESFFYATFCRVAWTLAVAWVTLCCCTGHGGIVNHVLSWPMWVPLGRLTLLSYLISPLVQLIYFCTLRTEFLVEHRAYVWIFFGNFAITYLLSFGGSMLVEAPFLSIEKLLFSKTGRQESVNLHKQTNQTVPNGLCSEKKDIIEVLEEKEKSLSINMGNDNMAFVQKL